MIGLITIATGKLYREYAKAMFNSARQHLPPHDQIVFTDGVEEMSERGNHRIVVSTPSYGFPEATLFRYKLFASQKYFLRMYYDYIFYCDADMEFVAPVGDIFKRGITATLHPGYVGTRGTPETRLASTAFTPANTAYYCGGFQGGDSKSFLEASDELYKKIDQDFHNGITAIWHDESHWNRYLADHPPSNVLTPAYCYPNVKNNYYTKKWEDAGLGKIEPILLALEKPWRKP